MLVFEARITLLHRPSPVLHPCRLPPQGESPPWRVQEGVSGWGITGGGGALTWTWVKVMRTSALKEGAVMIARDASGAHFLLLSIFSTDAVLPTGGRGVPSTLSQTLDSPSS